MNRMQRRPRNILSSGHFPFRIRHFAGPPGGAIWVVGGVQLGGRGAYGVTSMIVEPQNGSELRGLRVLVVEDSWHVANALKSLLAELGADVAGPAATLQDAERLLAAREPKVAIVDINLKGEMAYGLIETLHGRGISVVVISGYAVPQVAQSQVAAVLQKPFSAKALLAVLRQAAASQVP